MRLVVGLIFALGSAIALNWGYFAQHGAAAALPPLRLRQPLLSLRRLFASRRWLAGFLVGIGGWALYVAALVLAQLSLVQATSAGGIGVLALLVHFGAKDDRLSRRDWTAVTVAIAGLGLLGVSLAGAHGSTGSVSSAVVGLSLVAIALVAGLAVLSIKAGVPPAVALGVGAGILYATGDIATKAAVATTEVSFVPALLAAHGLAFVCLQLGFQRGSALVTVGLATLFTNALPIGAGSVLFHERLPGGLLGDCRLAAFVLVTAGAAFLARGGVAPSSSASSPRLGAAPV